MFQKPKVEKKEEPGRAPALSGDVQLVEAGDDGVPRYTKIASIALWPNDGRKGRQPHFKGKISPEGGGDSYAVSLWDRSKEVSK